MYEPLRRINYLSRLNLLVVLATCYDGYLRKILAPTDQAPVWGIIGPTSHVWNNELLKGMKEFYMVLFSEYNLMLALDALNKRNTIEDCIYELENAELMFCKVYRNYH